MLYNHLWVSFGTVPNSAIEGACLLWQTMISEVASEASGKQSTPFPPLSWHHGYIFVFQENFSQERTGKRKEYILSQYLPCSAWKTVFHNLESSIKYVLYIMFITGWL